MAHTIICSSLELAEQSGNNKMYDCNGMESGRLRFQWLCCVFSVILVYSTKIGNTVLCKKLSIHRNQKTYIRNMLENYNLDSINEQGIKQTTNR
jgi:hypothetical protein